MKLLNIKLLIITVLLFLLLSECKIKKSKPLEIIPFDYPDDITESGKQDFVKSFNQGHIVYNMNCAKCHSKQIDGKLIIPDFSLPQLMDYEIRIQYPDHAEPMREINLSTEELDKVILFLRYKRKNT